ncbi:hypothetical protein MP228_000935 [Amoeboaphelidium protococcarum]|nr:hypothetical protein MP228_000935 [Amoeboaphelidium protococcarum]
MSLVPSLDKVVADQPIDSIVNADTSLLQKNSIMAQEQNFDKQYQGHQPIRPTDTAVQESRNAKNPATLLTQRLTVDILSTYHNVNEEFRYTSKANPKRVLTHPSKPMKNDGYDNQDSDFILYVNDTLGDQDKKYQILDLLGSGTFGQVAKCKQLNTGKMMAVKVIKNKSAYFNQSMVEVTILELLNSKHDPQDKHHIVRLMETFIYKKHLCLVFEPLSINLYELIKQNGFKGLSLSLVKIFTSQILDALTVLSEANIIHCDLKPENILLKDLENPVIKVIDFGSACHDKQTVYTYIQSRFYRSPEVLLGMPYTSSIDLWSLGCISGELFVGLPLFPGASEYNQLSRIVEMIGLPPVYMMEFGKNSKMYFEKVALPNSNSNGSPTMMNDSFLPQQSDLFSPSLQRRQVSLQFQQQAQQQKYQQQVQFQWRLKSIQQFNLERGAEEKPSKRYFSALTLSELIRSYPISKKIQNDKSQVDSEMLNRACFLDFLRGLLALNPLERWSAYQALQHPFITGQAWNGPFKPELGGVRKFQSTPVESPALQSSVQRLHSGGDYNKIQNQVGSSAVQKQRIRANTIVSSQFAVPLQLQKVTSNAVHSQPQSGSRHHPSQTRRQSQLSRDSPKMVINSAASSTEPLNDIKKLQSVNGNKDNNKIGAAGKGAVLSTGSSGSMSSQDSARFSNNATLSASSSGSITLNRLSTEQNFSGSGSTGGYNNPLFSATLADFKPTNISHDSIPEYQQISSDFGQLRLNQRQLQQQQLQQSQQQQQSPQIRDSAGNQMNSQLPQQNQQLSGLSRSPRAAQRRISQQARFKKIRSHSVSESYSPLRHQDKD